MKKDVAVIGAGQSSFVRGFEGSIRNWPSKPSGEAMQDAASLRKMWKPPFSVRLLNMTSNAPCGVLAEYLVLFLSRRSMWKPFALPVAPAWSAYSMIKSGLHDVVVVLGFQKIPRSLLPNPRREWVAGLTSSGKLPSGPWCPRITPSMRRLIWRRMVSPTMTWWS